MRKRLLNDMKYQLNVRYGLLRDKKVQLRKRNIQLRVLKIFKNN